MAKEKKERIERFETAQGYQFRILSKKNIVLATSPSYAKKGPCSRVANKLGADHGFEVVEEE